MASRVKVLYVMGHGWSGSTILGNVVGELEGFFHAGELRRLWREALPSDAPCGCGRKVTACPVWSSILGHPLVSGLDPAEVDRWHQESARVRGTLRLLRFRPGLPTGWEALDRYLDAAGRLYRAIAEVTGARVVVDTSKRSGDAAALLLMPGIDPSFVHLIRDPRAVAHSWARRPDGRHGPLATSRDWLAFNLLDAAIRWRAGRGRSMRVRYEGFVADPARTVAAIAGMVGEPSSHIPLQGALTALLGVNHGVMGNPSRFATGLVELREDDEWKTAQPSRDRWTVTLLTLPLLLRYGYPVGRRARRLP